MSVGLAGAGAAGGSPAAVRVWMAAALVQCSSAQGGCRAPGPVLGRRRQLDRGRSGSGGRPPSAGSGGGGRAAGAGCGVVQCWSSAVSAPAAGGSGFLPSSPGVAGFSLGGGRPSPSGGAAAIGGAGGNRTVQCSCGGGAVTPLPSRDGGGRPSSSSSSSSASAAGEVSASRAMPASAANSANIAIIAAIAAS